MKQRTRPGINGRDDLPVLPSRRGHRALGDVFVSDDVERVERSSALSDAAHNLLVKASHRIEAADQAAAVRYIRRASALPWDDFERGHPAVDVADLFAGDELEAAVLDADEGDDAWLSTALAVLQDATGAGALSLRHALRDLTFEIELTPGQRRRIEQATRGLGRDPDHGIDADSTPAQVELVVAEIVVTAMALHLALFH